MLEKNGIRIPTLDEPWTRTSSTRSWSRSRTRGKFEYPLNLGMADKGEWYPYAFGPILQSFGGDLVDRSTYQTAEGALNGDAAIEFGEWWQSLFERRAGAGHLAEPRRPAERLRRGQVRAELYRQLDCALRRSRSSATTCCSCRRSTSAPAAKIGAASWQFAVSAKSEHQDGANAFIEFALQDKYFTAFSDGIGLIPPTRRPRRRASTMRPAQPMEVFYDLSEKQGTLRPVTPGYVVESQVFQKAVADIADGADVATVLDTAVDEIDADIENNQGYGHTSEPSCARAHRRSTC